MDQGSNIAQAKPGDLLERCGALISHWGVFTGDGVVHFMPEGESNKSKTILDRPVPGVVKEDPFETFLGIGKLRVHDSKASKFTANEIVVRARSKIGPATYQLSTNNCEHLATSTIGQPKSTQVEFAWKTADGFLKNLFQEFQF
uniref:phospholipase A and acyltransferase 3-like n=1 Tax=Pristiophorus japonicus TaxID=55135 RepID=UPI00398EFE51